MTELAPFLNRVDYLNDTAAQIAKDFRIAGIEIHYSGNLQNAYVELFEQILPHIDEILKGNFQEFYNLMYRIDISEAQIKKAVKESIDKSFSETVTDQILKRELLKVVIRKQISEGKEL